MSVAVAIVLGAGVLAWSYLLLCRGGYWRLRERVAPHPDPAAWPAVVAIVPARDEADVIARTIRSVVRQDYPGTFRVILVDDRSSDGTAETARAAVTDSEPRWTRPRPRSRPSRSPECVPAARSPCGSGSCGPPRRRATAGAVPRRSRTVLRLCLPCRTRARRRGPAAAPGGLPESHLPRDRIPPAARVPPWRFRAS